MRFLLAAAVATMAALLELTFVPRLSVNGAHPHLVLVLGVIWTLAAGAESGLVWAFVGGLALDILAPRPLGSTAAALLLALGGVSLIRPPTRFRPLAPILLVPIASLVSSVALLVFFGLAGMSLAARDVVPSLIPGVAYDTAVAAVLGPLAIVLHDRRHAPEEAET